MVLRFLSFAVTFLFKFDSHHQHGVTTCSYQKLIRILVTSLLHAFHTKLKVWASLRRSSSLYLCVCYIDSSQRCWPRLRDSITDWTVSSIICYDSVMIHQGGIVFNMKMHPAPSYPNLQLVVMTHCMTDAWTHGSSVCSAGNWTISSFLNSSDVSNTFTTLIETRHLIVLHQRRTENRWFTLSVK